MAFQNRNVLRAVETFYASKNNHTNTRFSNLSKRLTQPQRNEVARIIAHNAGAAGPTGPGRRGRRAAAGQRRRNNRGAAAAAPAERPRRNNRSVRWRNETARGLVNEIPANATPKPPRHVLAGLDRNFYRAIRERNHEARRRGEPFYHGWGRQGIRRRGIRRVLGSLKRSGNRFQESETELPTPTPNIWRLPPSPPTRPRPPRQRNTNVINGNGGGNGGATGGRKKRKHKRKPKRKTLKRKTTKRKSKARMTTQKRKVNGVTRNVRISSTGRKYVLLKGKRHYL